MKIYIAGPIGNRPASEFVPHFQKAAEAIEAAGNEALNPVALCAHLPSGSTWEQYMQVCLNTVLFDAEGIYLLEGWEDSPGAEIEFNVARRRCLETFYEGPYSSR